MAQYSPEQFGARLDQFAVGFSDAIAVAVFVAAQQLESDITGRIFGEDTQDVDGGTRGYRTESWVTKREDANLSINRVNLQFTGDLKKSPKLFEEKAIKAVSLKIVGQKQVDKARGNERWFEQENGAKVFEASVLEEKNARLAFEDELTNYIQKFFD